MFRFEVSHVERLVRANAVLLEGVLLQGVIRTGDTARLQLPDGQVEVQVKGVVRLAREVPGKFSLTVALHQLRDIDIPVGTCIKG